LSHCAACRQELAGLRGVVAAMEAAPMPDPGPEFWREFSRELHLKLVQTAHTGQAAPAPPGSWWRRLPYLLGAPAVAVLLVWLAAHISGPGIPVRDQAVVRQPGTDKLGEVARQSPAPPAAPRMASKRESSPVPPAVNVVPAARLAPFVTVAVDEGVALPPEEEMDVSDFGLDSELAGMTDQEKEKFLNRLDQQKKDGSCIQGFSYCSWG